MAVHNDKEKDKISSSNGSAIVSGTNTNDGRMRLWRIFIVSQLFVFALIYELNQQSFIINSFLKYGIDTLGENGTSSSSVPLSMQSGEKREWDRMLFGIFTYDSPNEAFLRSAARDTHLMYYHYYNSSTDNTYRPDTICSLREILSNATLAKDPHSCRVIYTFVLGGGIGDPLLRRKVDKLKGGRKAASSAKTRCLYEDPECGGTDIAQWTVSEPLCNISAALKNERRHHADVTLLRIPENHELGKTDTWFTYMAMLTRQRPDLQIGSVGKIDSDNFVRWHIFFQFLEINAKEQIQTVPFLYGGYAIHKKVCSGRTYGKACAQKEFIAECFASGAIAYLSTPLAQHVYMDGTTLERKREVWMVGEDMQLGNMAYSDKNLTPYVINHRYGRYGEHINVHCFNDPGRYRKEYYALYPEQKMTLDT